MQGDDGFLPIMTKKGPYKSEQSKFKDRVEAKLAEATKNRKPFCSRCAYLDFDKFKNDVIEAERTGYVDFKKLGIKLPKLEEYGDKDRFELIREGETANPKNAFKNDLASMQKWKEYRCKFRSCKITIFEA